VRILKIAVLQAWSPASNVMAILLMSIVLLLLGRVFHHATPSLWPRYFNTSLVSGFGLAMISVLWAYEGWQYVTYNAGEVINPRRNFPLGLIIGTAALVGIYLLANLGYLAALGGIGVPQSDRLPHTAVPTVQPP